MQKHYASAASNSKNVILHVKMTNKKKMILHVVLLALCCSICLLYEFYNNSDIHITSSSSIIIIVLHNDSVTTTACEKHAQEPTQDRLCPRTCLKSRENTSRGNGKC